MIVILKRNWWNYALRGLLAVLFGVGICIAAIVAPAVTLSLLVMVFGAYAIVEGLFALVAAARQYGQEGWALLLLEGLAGLVIGALAFLWTGISALVLITFIAAWALFTGILQISAALRMSKTMQGEWFLGLSGLVSMILGTLILVFPGIGAVGVMWFIGVYAVIFGFLMISLGFKARQLQIEEGMDPPEALRPEAGQA